MNEWPAEKENELVHTPNDPQEGPYSGAGQAKKGYLGPTTGKEALYPRRPENDRPANER